MNNEKRLETSLRSMEKSAVMSLLTGGGAGGAAGYIKGKKVGKAREGATAGALGGAGGQMAGGTVGALSTLAGMSLVKKKALSKMMDKNPALVALALAGPTMAGSIGGGLLGYKTSTRYLDMERKAKKEGGKKKTSASKVTFSPAMDESPVLKGKQSKLPDKIQAAILKKKGKKKEGSIDFVGGLSQASGALYTDLYAKRGLEKQAFIGSVVKRFAPGITSNLFRTTAAAGGGAATLAALAKARRLHTLSSSGKEGFAARRALVKQRNLRRAEEAAASAKGEKFVPKALDRSAEELEFLKKVRGLRGKTFKDAPSEFISAYAPEVGRAALESGAAGAVTGASAKALANWHKRNKMVEAAKAVAVPAALGLGGYALLKD